MRRGYSGSTARGRDQQGHTNVAKRWDRSMEGAAGATGPIPGYQGEPRTRLNLWRYASSADQSEEKRFAQ